MNATETPPTDETERTIRNLQQTVGFYRAVLILFFLGLCATGWTLYRNTTKVSEFGHAGEVWTVDLQARLDEINRDAKAVADVSQAYFVADGASVHMHFMGLSNTTPLHIHPENTEAVVIAGGRAETTQIWAEDGQLQSRKGPNALHTLIASPPNTAHEWRNPDDGAFLANLVFTAPLFNGNFYIRPDDPRILQGTAPFLLDVSRGAEAVAEAGDAFRIRRLEAMDGRLHHLHVADGWTLPGNSGQPVIAYVAAGEGTVEGEALRPQTLVHLEQRGDMTITATPGSPLAILLFDPYGALSEEG